MATRKRIDAEVVLDQLNQKAFIHKGKHDHGLILEALTRGWEVFAARVDLVSGANGEPTLVQSWPGKEGCGMADGQGFGCGSGSGAGQLGMDDVGVGSGDGWCNTDPGIGNGDGAIGLLWEFDACEFDE